ncbi:MAG: hypothetical protein KAW02_06515 [candidate division Zixibacteria bacterium]|nr:hypothetical protein [candidate division Zixibacteria bacterium]
MLVSKSETRLAAKSLKMREEKETTGMRISSIELLGRISATSLDNDSPKTKEFKEV